MCLPREGKVKQGGASTAAHAPRAAADAAGGKAPDDDAALDGGGMARKRFARALCSADVRRLSAASSPGLFGATDNNQWFNCKSSGACHKCITKLQEVW